MLYSHVESPIVPGQPAGRIPLTERGSRFYFRSKTHQCTEGIFKRQAELLDDGLYASSLILWNNTYIDSNIIEVTIYKGW